MSEGIIDEVLDNIETYKEELKRYWANGNFTSDTIEGTIQLNSEAIGKYRVLEDIEELISSLRKERGYE